MSNTKEIAKPSSQEVAGVKDFQGIEAFLKVVNIAPRKREIAVNKMAGNSRYLPVSFVQMKLDEFFFGLWSWEVVDVKVVANEILVWGNLKVYHPKAQVWLNRSGTGATMIQMKSDRNGGNGDITDIGQKIKNTLVKDFPHAESEALKNAAKKLGKAFGRDLNRKLEDQYTSFIDTMTDAKESEMDIDAGLDNCRTIAALGEFYNHNKNLFEGNDILMDKLTKRRKELEKAA